jgi:hypothetical protein
MRIRFWDLWPSSIVTNCLLRLAGFTHVNTLTEKSALHRITRKNERSAKVFACNLVPSKAMLKFAQRGEVERVGREAITVGNSVDFFEPTLGALVQRDRDSTIETDNRGRTWGRT